jgi:hypothetical protein
LPRRQRRPLVMLGTELEFVATAEEEDVDVERS